MNLCHLPEDIYRKISKNIKQYDDFVAFRNCHPNLRKCIRKYNKTKIHTKLKSDIGYPFLNTFEDVDISGSKHIIDCSKLKSIRKLNCMCCHRVQNLEELNVRRLEVCDATMFMACDITISQERLMEAILKMPNLKCVVIKLHHIHTKFGYGPFSKWKLRDTLDKFVSRGIDYELTIEGTRVMGH